MHTYIHTYIHTYLHKHNMSFINMSNRQSCYLIKEAQSKDIHQSAQPFTLVLVLSERAAAPSLSLPRSLSLSLTLSLSLSILSLKHPWPIKYLNLPVLAKCLSIWPSAGCDWTGDALVEFPSFPTNGHIRIRLYFLHDTHTHTHTLSLTDTCTRTPRTHTHSLTHTHLPSLSVSLTR